MTTYSKLYSSISKDSRDENLQNKYQSTLTTPSGATSSKRISPYAKPKLDPYSDSEPSPSTFNQDPDMDALGMLEVRLRNLQTNYMKKIIYWKKQKLALLAEHALKENSESVKNHNRRETLARMLQEIKSLFQFADAHLRDVYKSAAPAILMMEENLSNSCDQLEHLPKDSSEAKIQEEDTKLRLEICNQSINILNGCTSLINDVSREIKLCVKLEEIIEKTAVFLLDVLMRVLIPIPIPKFDFNFHFGSLYRNFLFSEIRPEATRIENLTLESEGLVKKANNLLNPKDNAQTNQKLEEANKDTVKTNTQIIVPEKSPSQAEQFFQKNSDDKKEIVYGHENSAPMLAPSI